MSECTPIVVHGTDQVAVDPRPGSRTVYADVDGRLERSRDQGVTWALVHGLSAEMLLGTSTDGALFVSERDGLLSSNDQGDTWKRLTHRSFEAVAIDPSASSSMYGAALTNGVFASHDGGTQWDPLGTGLEEYASDVLDLAIDANGATLYAVTLDPGIFEIAVP